MEKKESISLETKMLIASNLTIADFSWRQKITASRPPLDQMKEDIFDRFKEYLELLEKD